MSKSLSDWLDYICCLYPSDIDLSLDRIKVLAEPLSLTQFMCPVVTVAGTNGKGSIIRFLETIYLKAGYRVAAYTSPHILKFNERLRINGENLADQSWLQAFERIENVKGKQALSFFEYTTLAALLICQSTSLDLLLLEVGLGGRLDAVNVVDSNLAIISNVALDHMDWLGFDRESIGREKAGIVRVGEPVICGDPDPPQSILQIVKEQSAPFYNFRRDYNYVKEASNWRWEGPDGEYKCLPYPQLKLQNAATSLMAVSLLQPKIPVTQYAVITGIKTACLLGRFEMVNVPVKLIYDVAHNPQSMAYFAQRIKALPRQGKTLAVIGMLRDKAIGEAMAELIELVDEWYITSLDVHRGAKADEIMSELTARDVKNCYNFTSVEKALQEAMNHCQEQDWVLVFGSFYTVGKAKAYILERTKVGEEL